MSGVLRWGILGTGNIARQFCTGVNQSHRGKLMAVGSRASNTAAAFAADFRIPSSFGSYDAVLDRADVDAVYVSLPNSMHHEWTLKALRAGKHVLCEKPLASNTAQSQEMFDAADSAGRVLVEAFMYRAHPLTHAVMKAVGDGAIGQVRLIRSSFCYFTRRMEGNIRFNAELAGGALMDIGCYCINFSNMVAGQAPSEIHATGHLHESGVDDLAVATMQYSGGVAASFTCGMAVHADNTAYICGSEGYIEVPIPWKPPQQQAAFTIARSTPPRMDSGGRPISGPPPRDTHHVDAAMDLYGVEADAFAAVVLDGQRPFVTRDETLATMRILDDMRRQLGVRIWP